MSLAVTAVIAAAAEAIHLLEVVLVAAGGLAAAGFGVLAVILILVAFFNALAESNK